MREVCFCGRVGEIEDREPVDADGGPALRCPSEACGHLDRLDWLPRDALWPILKEAFERRTTLRRPAA